MSFSTVNNALTNVQSQINKQFRIDSETASQCTLIVNCMQHYLLKADRIRFNEYVDTALDAYPGHTSAILYSLYAELKIGGIDELDAELIAE